MQICFEFQLDDFFKACKVKKKKKIHSNDKKVSLSVNFNVNQKLKGDVTGSEIGILTSSYHFSPKPRTLGCFLDLAQCVQPINTTAQRKNR